MLEKWADYLVSAKRNSDNSSILSLRVHEDKVNSVGQSFIETRNTVISNIENAIDYVTIYLDNATGKYHKGANINVINTDYGKYLRTDKNKTPKDNLDNLPDF